MIPQLEILLEFLLLLLPLENDHTVLVVAVSHLGIVSSKSCQSNHNHWTFCQGCSLCLLLSRKRNWKRYKEGINEISHVATNLTLFLVNRLPNSIQTLNYINCGLKFTNKSDLLMGIIRFRNKRL